MLQVEPQSLIGTWRRFGIAGPVYEVLSEKEDGQDKKIMRIRVVETGEELDYKLVDVLEDPKER